ncbi:MAG: hypothetical protein FJZ01_06650 [Candidatus Sericytochromatia bacterium]|nr:hypothetical protein [Candidatus Tanganyikabacteria bacterium]
MPRTSNVAFSVAPPFQPDGAAAALRQARLLFWDEWLHDVLELPAAGRGALGPSVLDDGRVVFYRVDGGIFAFDPLTETTVPFAEANAVGEAFRASITKDGRVMVFLADPRGTPARIGVSGRDPGPDTRAYLWIDGVAAELAPVNELAAQEGGIDRIKVAGKARVVSFSTRTGGNHVWPLGAGPIQKLETPPARDPALDDDATIIAWVDARGLDPRQVWVNRLATVSLPVERARALGATNWLLPPSSGAAVPAPGSVAMEFVTLHDPILLPEIPLAAGGVILSLSPSKDRLRFTSYERSAGIFRVWRYRYFGSLVEQLATLNMAQ